MVCRPPVVPRAWVGGDALAATALQVRGIPRSRQLARIHPPGLSPAPKQATQKIISCVCIAGPSTTAAGLRLALRHGQ